MKRGTIWILVICLMVTSLILASCSTSTSTTTQQTTTSTTVSSSTPTTTPTTITTVTSTASTSGHWWDSLGTPKYGGDLVIRVNKDIANFDPYNAATLMTIENAWMEKLFADDWTIDPTVFKFQVSFRPHEYVKGFLAESWEFTDPSTLVISLRHGIHYQNISPVNGREFTSDDVVYHYDRLLGLGYGFTKPSPYYSTVANWKSLVSVTAIDKYTIAFKWSSSNPEFILDTIQPDQNGQCIEAREAVQQWGDLNDWHHAIGTGPFILQDFVSGSSATLIKNPNYWGYDERFPQNQLPYVDTLKILIVIDNATALSGLRTGKIDVLDQVSLQSAQSIQKTNPEIVQVTIPSSTTITLDPRNDTKPLNDIRVRESMQMAIDLPTISTSYYGGVVSPYPSTMTADLLKGWGWPYDQWPQELKDEYAYNPAAAKQLLATAGYPNGFKTDVVADIAGDVDLLQIIKSYFSAVGIDMDIRTMDSASWVTFVSSHKNDQLATRPTGSLGFTSDPFTQLSKFQKGSSVNFAMVNDPVYEAFYTNAMSANSVDDIKQVVRDANEYVARQHFMISLLRPMQYGLYQPWLKGYNGQLDAISGVGVGPLLMNFYLARFWIDQNLKKSMGH